MNELLLGNRHAASWVVHVVLLSCAVVMPRIALGLDGETADSPRLTARIIKERDCFAGIFQNYDIWISALDTGKENGGDREFYEERYPRAEYELFKRDLDCRFFLYNVGELTVEGYYVKLRRTGGGRLPVIISNRGGNAEYGKVKFGSLFFQAFPLASAGFVVVGSQYRGAGIPANEGNNGEDEFGGKDVNDVLALFDIVDQWAFADPERIGMLGWSRGGMMAFLVAARTDRLSALVVGGTPTDLRRELQFRPEMERVFRARMPNYEANKESSLRARSAYYWPERIDASIPILMLHGQADERVAVSGILHMAVKLQELGRTYRLIIYDSGSHGLLEYRDEVNGEIQRWFRRFL